MYNTNTVCKFFVVFFYNIITTQWMSWFCHPCSIFDMRLLKFNFCNVQLYKNQVKAAKSNQFNCQTKLIKIEIKNRHKSREQNSKYSLDLFAFSNKLCNNNDVKHLRMTALSANPDQKR